MYITFSLLKLFLAWLLIVGGARRFQVELNHYAVHNRLFISKVMNRAFIQVTSTILFLQDYAGYQHDHVRMHHNKEVFAGPNDPDWVFLRSLGLAPGMTRKECWLWLARTVVSPEFHAKFLSSRLKANFLSPDTYRRWMSVGWTAALLATVSLCHEWIAFMVLCVFPLTVLYHIAALVQFSCEHKWNAPVIAGESARSRNARLSLARYCITAPPLLEEDASRGVKVCGWLVWLAVVISIDLPWRVFSIVGDMPVHDRHHNFAANTEWANVVYLDRDGGTLASPECWGLIQSLNHVFDHIAALPKE
ncbi:fatty acid desaturase [Caballeronia sp. ATUFL_F1_KS39]|uniref:fatty acid desaturase n=1 Tax=Caballeronia sp. ATUFL_F1_KS39 TaxID=2921766 RepID=UPI002028489C|nr:fatty acid desaturase [Caballeronia sp. ATUFL_F1_KS39]